jgi:hypothetical protein
MENQMGECKIDNSNKTESSCGSDIPEQEEHCTMAEDILCLAKCAKHELLKEKMKKLLEAKIGKKLDKVAEVAVDAVLACMEHKMAAKHACHQYEENLMAAFRN